ncbi:MAG: DsrE family protein [Gammaproteobacteria bacterium]|nr:DsrE family protein [Gammaproteobacteria bacterium]
MTQAQTKLSFTITGFDKDPDRVAVPLVLANNALAMGSDVLLWLTLEGVQLAKKGAYDHLIPRSFPPIRDLMETFKESGGKIGVCPPCAKTHGVSNDNMADNAQWMGAAAILEENQQRQTAWF